MKETVKLIRSRLALSQAELAKVLDVSQSNVSWYECGRQNMPPPVGAKLITYARSKGQKLSFNDLYASFMEKVEKKAQ